MSSSFVTVVFVNAVEVDVWRVSVTVALLAECSWGNADQVLGKLPSFNTFTFVQRRIAIEVMADDAIEGRLVELSPINVPLISG